MCQSRTGVGYVRVGGTVGNTLTRGGTEKRGNKDFKKGEQSGSKGGCLKNGGGTGSSLRTIGSEQFHSVFGANRD